MFKISFFKLSGVEAGLEELKSKQSSLTESKNQDESDQDILRKELDAWLLNIETQMKDMELEGKKWKETLDVEALSLESENKRVKIISAEIEKIREELIICDEELSSSENKMKEENTQLSGLEEDIRRAEKTAVITRSRTDKLVSQLENKEGAVNSLKEQLLEVNLELEKEQAASLPVEEDKMYETECEKYENLMIELECLEKALQEGSDRLEDLQFQIAEVKRSGEEFAKNEKYTDVQEVFFYHVSFYDIHGFLVDIIFLSIHQFFYKNILLLNFCPFPFE